MLFKNWWTENKVFFFIFLATIISGVMSIFSEYLGENVFVRSNQLINPVQVCVNDCGLYYISESSKKILITDKENQLLYTIEGADAETTFEYAAELAVEDNGTIYVHDKIWNENGSATLHERILKFDAKGKRKSVVYEIDTVDENEKQSVSLDSLKVIDGKVYFSEITKEGVYIYEVTKEALNKIAYAPHTNSNNEIADTSFYVNTDGVEIAILMKNGDIIVSNNEKEKEVYQAREYDTDEYFSLISEISYGEDKRLYLCDVGQREVYRLCSDYSKKETIITRRQFSLNKSEMFSESPLYTGLNVANGVVSILTSEYTYNEVSDEENYTYGLAAISENGEKLFYYDSVNVSLKRRIMTIFVYISLVFLIIMAVCAFVKVIHFLKKSEFEGNMKKQLIVVVTAIVVTLSVSSIIFNQCDARFVKEVASNLCNIAYLIGEKINSEELVGLNNPDAYLTQVYDGVDKSVKEVLKSKINEESNIYCVIYKVKNDVVCEVYRDDRLHGVMYPMAGRFKDSVEEKIALTNDYEVSYKFALSEGTYMYALIPVYDDNGETLAFIETGTDYSTFKEENNALYTKILMLTAMMVIIVMLLFSEFLWGVQAVKVRKINKAERKICSPEIIRPVSFLFFAIANISTAFLPIYGMELWNEQFPVRIEVAAAFPLSAELICAAISAFACGFFIQKTGIKGMCILGGGLYVIGNVLSIFAGNLWVLIVANAVCGIGSGCLSMALNTWAASYSDEEKQNKGFIHINAAYLAGLNCGTVIGSLIWEKFGIKETYFVGAISAVLLIIFSIIMIDKITINTEENDKKEDGSFKNLISPAVIRYFLCISVPYLICTAFLEYFFPIKAETEGLSATYISMAFLLSGLISIYIGSSLAEPITTKFGMKKTMILASFIYAVALIYLVINPTIGSCYVVVVLFAIADSFGLSAQSVYFSSMQEVKRAGQRRALGVNNTIESITSACGSLIFGAVLTLGIQRGIMIIALVFMILLAIFVLGERKSG